MTAAESEVLSTEVEYKVKRQWQTMACRGTVCDNSEEECAGVQLENSGGSGPRAMVMGRVVKFRGQITWCILSQHKDFEFHFLIIVFLDDFIYVQDTFWLVSSFIIPKTFLLPPNPISHTCWFVFLFRALQSLTRGTCVTSDLDLSFRYWWGSQRLRNWILCLSLFHNLLVTKCSIIFKKLSRGFKRSPKRW